MKVNTHARRTARLKVALHIAGCTVAAYLLASIAGCTVSRSGVQSALQILVPPFGSLNWNIEIRPADQPPAPATTPADAIGLVINPTTQKVTPTK